MSGLGLDRQGASWRALAVVVALTVAAVILVPGAWQSLRPGAGSAQAQTTDNPPTQTEPKEGEVSEFLEAAKLAALASGNVVAGPGQVIIPAGSGDGTISKHLLWDGVPKEVTLTVQVFGGCRIFFEFFFRTRDDSVDDTQFFIGPTHESKGMTIPETVQILYFPSGGQVASDCLFLWVLRETGVSVRRPG